MSTMKDCPDSDICTSELDFMENRSYMNDPNNCLELLLYA